jgi:hypothetical protein
MNGPTPNATESRLRGVAVLVEQAVSPCGPPIFQHSGRMPREASAKLRCLVYSQFVTRLIPVVSAICGAAFAVAVCSALGSLLLRRLGLEFQRMEGALFAFVSGSAVLSLAVFGLCLVHQARLGVFLAGGAVAGVWAVWEARRDRPREPLPPLPRAWAILFLAVFAAFLACYFCNALAPEISPDGSSYHLGNVARYWRHRGFDGDYHSIYSSLSQGMEMLFLVAFSIGRHSAAAMVHMAFQATLPLLILCYGRRFGFPRTGAFAGLLIYACPVVGITGISAYNDLAVATLIFAGFYLLEVNYENSSGKRIFLIGLLSGATFAIKYTAGLILPLSAAMTRGRRITALCLGATITAGPWIVRNWVWLGNPAAPFLNSWFPNRYWTAGAEHQYLAGLRQYPTFHSYWDLCLQLTVLGGLVPGMIGPAFLLLPLSLLALRHPHGRRLLLAAAVYSIPAFLNTETRFLIPVLPFLALSLGLAMENSWGVLPVVALFQAILCWPTVMDSYCDRNAWRIRGFQAKAAFRLEPESEFIGSHVGDYALKAAIEQAVPPGGKIFSFAGRAAAYLDRDIVVGYESSQGMRIQEALQNAASANSGQRAAALVAKSEGCGFLLVNDADGVSQNMKNNFNIWGITALAKANGVTLYRVE